MHVRFSSGGAIIGLTIAALGIFMTAMAVQMPMGTASLPGPGVFPTILGLLLVALGSALVLTCRRLTQAEPVVAIADYRVVSTLLSLAWVGLTLEIAGAEIAFAVFVLVSLRIHAERSWLISAVAGVAISIAVCWIFRVALGVNLPIGFYKMFVHI